MRLSLNWFRCDYSPNVVQLPCRAFTSAEEAKAARKASPALLETCLWVSRAADSAPQAMLVGVDGRELDSFSRKPFDLKTEVGVAKRVGRFAIGEYFRSLDYGVFDEHFAASVSIFSPGHMVGKWIRIRTGICVSLDKPFFDSPMGAIVQWSTRVEVPQRLDNPELAKQADGLSCVLEVEGKDDSLSAQVLARNNRVIGILESMKSGIGSVRGSSGQLHEIPLRYLRIQPNSTALARLDNKSSQRHVAGTIWHEKQKAALVLGKDNRRNAQVIKDRLREIRRFLGGKNSDVVVVPLPNCAGATLTIDLSPATVSVEALR